MICDSSLACSLLFLVAQNSTKMIRFDEICAPCNIGNGEGLLLRCIFNFVASFEVFR